MKWLWCFLLPTVALGQVSEVGVEVAEVRIAKRLAYDIEHGRLAEKTDAALDAIIRLSIAKLREKGEESTASEIEGKWQNEFRGTLSSRNIGDHRPLSLWLADVYEKLEAKLGLDLCKALHLSDIKVINYGLVVVFDPCNKEWDKEEYLKHFANDPKYGAALVPVIAFWTSEIICTAGTMGGGAFFICSPISMGVEWVMNRFIAPKLGNKVYDMSCK